MENRSEKSIRNIIAALVMTIINIICGFITQKIFTIQLGKAYLGLNGLFSNIISMLAIAELGIGTAIVYNLYKPIAEKNIKKIQSLMNLYKKSYRLIALIVLILGIIIMPFLNKIVGEDNISLLNDVNINIVFLLFLFDAVFSYVLTYKRSILYADQKNYIVNLVHTSLIIAINMLQILILLIFKNYYMFLIIKILCRVIENIIINIKVNKEYVYLEEKNVEKLDIETKKDISQRIRASILHNIGGYVVLGTDNILISSLFGIEFVGLYSNYLLILNTLNNLIGQAFTSVTSSVGNLLVEKNQNSSLKVAKKIGKVNLFIYIICSCMLYACLRPFISIWLGKEYLLNEIVTITLVINFYMQGMRKSMQLFAEAGGVCYENRFVPIAEAILNIVFSILLAKLFGLAGIFMGTIISSFALHFYSYPKYVYKNIFKQKPSKYIIDFLKNLFSTLLILLINILVINYICFDNQLYQLIFNFIFSLSSSLMYIILLYRNTDEYNFFYSIIKKICIKIMKKIKK